MSANRAQRRAIIQRVRATVRAAGCTCVPLVTTDDADGRGGWVSHAKGCPLGDRCAELWGRGVVVGVPVVAPTECQR